MAATIPPAVLWSYIGFGGLASTALAGIVWRREWQNQRYLDRLVLLGPLFYAAPLAAFATQHFTQSSQIAALVPAWLPWHLFLAWVVGACFLAGTLALATRVHWRLAARLLALVFLIFVVLMDVPGWFSRPHNRFALALALRELAFSGGALAFAAWPGIGGTRGPRPCRGPRPAMVAKYFLVIPLFFYAFEQLLHGDYVPGIPLNLVTPTWIFGHAVWTYLTAVVYLVAVLLLLAGKWPRLAATALGLVVLMTVLVVYVPMLMAQPTSLQAFNFAADTLMFAGALFLLAGSVAAEGFHSAASAP